MAFLPTSELVALVKAEEPEILAALKTWSSKYTHYQFFGVNVAKIAGKESGIAALPAEAQTRIFDMIRPNITRIKALGVEIETPANAEKIAHLRGEAFEELFSSVSGHVHGVVEARPEGTPIEPAIEKLFEPSGMARTVYHGTGDGMDRFAYRVAELGKHLSQPAQAASPRTAQDIIARGTGRGNLERF